MLLSIDSLIVVHRSSNAEKVKRNKSGKDG